MRTKVDTSAGFAVLMIGLVTLVRDRDHHTFKVGVPIHPTPRITTCYVHDQCSSGNIDLQAGLLVRQAIKLALPSPNMGV